jgi:plastocyanin
MRSSALSLVTVLIIPGILWAQTAAVSVRVQVARPGGKLEDPSGAVLWLTPAQGAAAAPAPLEHLRVVQHGKRFEPHLQVVPVGSTVEFPNRDPFFHNVFSLFDGKRFDLGLYEAGGNREVHFDRAGVSYIFCNIHSEMSAVVVSLATPYYSVSTRSGEVTIANVPPGRYVLHVWHEAASPGALNALTREVIVSAPTTSAGTLRLTDDGHLQLGHKNKYGEDYETPAPSGPIYPH